MTYTLKELKNADTFAEFKEYLLSLDEFGKFRNLYNVSDFEDQYDRADTCREIHRVNDLTDAEIYDKAKSNTTVEAYSEVEIGYCHYVRLVGDEYLEDYSEEDEAYSMSSFLGTSVEII